MSHSNFDPTEDLDVMDLTQHVTVHDAANDRRYPLVLALKRPLVSREPSPTGGPYLPGSAVWHLDRRELRSYAPTIADLVVEQDETTWYIERCEAILDGSRIKVWTSRVPPVA